jgi:hypothetical protein
MPLCCCHHAPCAPHQHENIGVDVYELVVTLEGEFEGHAQRLWGAAGGAHGGGSGGSCAEGCEPGGTTWFAPQRARKLLLLCTAADDSHTAHGNRWSKIVEAQNPSHCSICLSPLTRIHTPHPPCSS